MSNYFKTELDINTGEERKIDLTLAEIEELEKIKKEHFNKIIETQLKENAKIEIFNKLGITEDEARLLLG